MFSRKLITVVLAISFFGASARAAIVFDKGDWKERWSNCFAQEGQSLLQTLKIDQLDLKKYHVIGVEYVKRAPLAGQYAVDFQNDKDHIIRMQFSAYFTEKLPAYRAATGKTELAAYCTLQTDSYDDFTVLKVFDREKPDSVYLTKQGTGGKRPSDYMGSPI